MRSIVLDTETTGLDTEQGHRIIEIGCVELINRRLTGNSFHQYVNPDREIDEAAQEVHGISREFLQDKPSFHMVVEEFLEFVKGAGLIIHNAPFDIGFLNYEMELTKLKLGRMEEFCSVIDTLIMARQLHPGQKNNLDALCRRYDIDNSQRTLHGALLDAEILADVYLAMTGGQTSFLFDGEADANGGGQGETRVSLDANRERTKVIAANEEETVAHLKWLELLGKESVDGCVWTELELEK
jgi:DNA polymerase-3 subunit epsilon